MQRLLQNTTLREILRPLGQMLVFVLGTSLVVSLFVVSVAFLLRGTRPDQDILQLTLLILPQVILDGVVLGFVYATIALGYTMVYGVLEFINFAHGEIFMFGAFAGWNFYCFSRAVAPYRVLPC